MSGKEKIMLVTIITMILAITLINVPKLFINKNDNLLPEVKLEDIEKSKSFAIMVQNEEGTKYENYTGGDTWPIKEYRFSKAECIDSNGKLVENAISFNKENNTVSLTTNSTVYCTLYFDKPLNLRTFCEKYSNLQECMSKERNNTGEVVDLSPNKQGGIYRYQASPADESTSAKMGNWICFGTRDKNECTSDEGIDKYMYRIIGITEEGQLYLLKETFLKEETNTKFSWNNKHYTSGTYIYTCDDKICPEWNASLLFKRINGTSNGETHGTGSYTDGANTDIFVDSKYYDYLKSGDNVNGASSSSEWYNMIADHNWKYGDTIETSYAKLYNGNEIYKIENGEVETSHYVRKDGEVTLESYKWNETYEPVKAKISLMYIHDVDYAYYDGINEETRGVPNSSTNVMNSWIHFQKAGYNSTPIYEWLNTRWGIKSMGATSVRGRNVLSSGALDGFYSLFDSGGVRPVFYLESSAKISSGDGTKESPFILS